MSSLLTNHVLPLWTWIVIIVVGAVVVLGTLASITRCMIIRKRQADFVDIFGEKDLPERRVTVRRGRVVPSSRYLSLTGSRFGLNAFNVDTDESTSRGDRRSKSPFEWWSTTKSRSVSQLSRHSMSATELSLAPAGRKSPLNHLYQHSDGHYSSTTVASISTKDENVSTMIIEVKSDASARKPPPNFSRSLSRQGQHGSSPRGINTLSRIDEFSPHTSMISMTQSRVFSYASNRDTASTMDVPLSVLSTTLSSPQFPVPPSWNQQFDNLSTATDESEYHSAPGTPKKSLDLPRPLAYNGSKSSLGEIETSRRTSTTSNRISGTSTRSCLRHESQITALPTVRSNAQGYWEMRPDLQPVPSSSKKGRLLRKKSLKKAETPSKTDS